MNDRDDYMLHGKWLWVIALLPAVLIYLSSVMWGVEAVSVNHLFLRGLFLVCWAVLLICVKCDMELLRRKDINVSRVIRWLVYLVPPLYLGIRIVLSKRGLGPIVSCCVVIVGMLFLCAKGKVPVVREITSADVAAKFVAARMMMERGEDRNKAAELIYEADMECGHRSVLVPIGIRESAYWAMAESFANDFNDEVALRWYERAASLGGEEGVKKYGEMKLVLKQQKEERELEERRARQEELANCSSDVERMHLRGQMIAAVYNTASDKMPGLIDEFKGERVLIKGCVTTVAPDMLTMRCATVRNLTIICQHVEKNKVLNMGSEIYVLGKVSRWVADSLCLEPSAVVEE